MVYVLFLYQYLAKTACTHIDLIFCFMKFQSGNFTEFDRFKEVIKDWSLDFNILSKGDFKASFKLFTSDYFLLAMKN